MPASKFPKKSTALSIRMILLSNASDVYSQLQRMREIIHESHEYFAEYMRLYLPQEILLGIESAMRSVQIAMGSIGNSSDYIDTRNRMIFTEDAGHALKSHQATMQAVQNLFEEMLTESCRLILSFMDDCVSELLNETLMREILHLLKLTHADFFTKCLRIANAIPLFLKNRQELYYQALHQLCRVDVKSCAILAMHTDELCQIAKETSNDNVRSDILDILNLIVSRAAKALNYGKPSGLPNGIKRPDIQFNSKLYEKLPTIAATATEQLYREASAESVSIFHSTLRVIGGIWRITTRLGKPSTQIDVILSETVESLIDKLKDYEERDPKTRHLTMMVIAMLAKSSSSRRKLRKALVIRRLLEILDDTHQRYLKAIENNELQSNVSGYIADSETARSTSCESLVKNVSLSLLNEKQVAFASDCTLAGTGSKLYDISSTWRNSKGSLPNLSSSSLSLKQATSNGMLTNRTLKSLKNEQQTEFIQHILHNCAIALKRICDGGNSDYFHDCGGLEVVNKILSSDKSNQTAMPYLKELRQLMQTNHSIRLDNECDESNNLGIGCSSDANFLTSPAKINRQTSIPEEYSKVDNKRLNPNMNLEMDGTNRFLAKPFNYKENEEEDEKVSGYLPSTVLRSLNSNQPLSKTTTESSLKLTVVEEVQPKQTSSEMKVNFQPTYYTHGKDLNEITLVNEKKKPGVDCYFDISKDDDTKDTMHNHNVTDYVSSASLQANKPNLNPGVIAHGNSLDSDFRCKHRESIYLPPENSIRTLMRAVDGLCHNRESDTEVDTAMPRGNPDFHQNYDMNCGKVLFESVSGTKAVWLAQPPADPATTYIIKTTTSS